MSKDKLATADMVGWHPNAVAKHMRNQNMAANDQPIHGAAAIMRQNQSNKGLANALIGAAQPSAAGWLGGGIGPAGWSYTPNTGGAGSQYGPLDYVTEGNVQIQGLQNPVFGLANQLASSVNQADAAKQAAQSTAQGNVYSSYYPAEAHGQTFWGDPLASMYGSQAQLAGMRDVTQMNNEANWYRLQHMFPQGVPGVLNQVGGMFGGGGGLAGGLSNINTNYGGGVQWT